MPVVIVTYIFIAKELFVIQSDISWTLLFNIHNVLSYAIRSDLYRVALVQLYALRRPFPYIEAVTL